MHWTYNDVNLRTHTHTYAPFNLFVYLNRDYWNTITTFQANGNIWNKEIDLSNTYRLLYIIFNKKTKKRKRTANGMYVLCLYTM